MVQVYRGEVCLNTVQISALLALDTRRALDRAAKSVKALDEQCCAVMAVFGDIQHSAGTINLDHTIKHLISYLNRMELTMIYIIVEIITMVHQQHPSRYTLTHVHRAESQDLHLIS